jgi:hypothetical protein
MASGIQVHFTTAVISTPTGRKLSRQQMEEMKKLHAKVFDFFPSH